MLESAADVLSGDIFGSDDETPTPTTEDLTDENPRRKTSEGKPRATVKPAPAPAKKGTGPTVEAGAGNAGESSGGDDSSDGTAS